MHRFVPKSVNVQDVYDAGHSHLYAVTWPMLGGKAVQKDYNDPKGDWCAVCPG